MTSPAAGLVDGARLSIITIMSTNTASSLASVVHIPKRSREWAKLDDDEELSMLHAAFWGKGMAEEDAWRRDKQQSTSYPSESKDDDADESEDDNFEMGYVLDINNSAIDIPSIWVRVSVFTMGLTLSS